MYDRRHILLTWGGTLPGEEEWSCGIRLAGRLSAAEMSPLELTYSDALLAELMTSYVPAVKAYHQDPNTSLNARALLTHVKCANIGQDGKYVSGKASMVEEFFAPLPGGQATVAGPNQISIAVTTTTDQPRGLAKMGRFYLPMPSMFPNADGLIPASVSQALAARSKTFLEAISDVPGIDVITSPGASVMSKVGNGVTNRITGVKVGRVLDTQRRRRRSLPETYSETTVDQGIA